MLPMLICACSTEYSVIDIHTCAEPELCQAKANRIYFIVILQITDAKKSIAFVKSASAS